MLTFLNERVQQLTNGTHIVTCMDRMYLSSCASTGLTFAYVPKGEDANSHNAKYFGIAGDSNGVYFADRASDTSIAKNIEKDIASKRQQSQREAGKAAAAKLLTIMQLRMIDVINRHSFSLTAEQLQDIHAVTGVSLDKQQTLFFERIDSLDLEKIFTILAILGQTELPSY